MKVDKLSTKTFTGDVDISMSVLVVVVGIVCLISCRVEDVEVESVVGASGTMMVAGGVCVGQLIKYRIAILYEGMGFRAVRQ
ncbi:hypothetical protein Tco_1469405, partial [Tanacetum coccineum]